MGNGRRLLEYRLEEATNAKESSSLLADELGFFDGIDQLILDFLNRSDKLLPGESKHYALCSLVRTQLIKSCNNMLRHHVGDAFAANETCDRCCLVFVADVSWNAFGK
ncbi:hypothetical protein GA0061105_10421 [Rhizobium aethiopicum]|uniref:Uncharacterized protein n=2 Tax=Rhizobium aethiopicum TaxID=1138170 RepID=A0A1C3Y0T5_9HYPH|nr:hypothetical protein GA0061105_10421 [Rhizobium aethiopicum]